MTKPPIILDIEASGFGIGSYPVEIGYVNPEGGTWCALVRPEPEWLHWDTEAEKLHHLSRETLLTLGQAPAAIAQHLNQVFAGQVVYTDAWLNDFVWLSCLYEAAGRVPSFKLEDLRYCLTAGQREAWHVAKQEVVDSAAMNSAAMKRHRASADARLLQLTWLKTREMRSLAAG